MIVVLEGVSYDVCIFNYSRFFILTCMAIPHFRSNFYNLCDIALIYLRVLYSTIWVSSNICLNIFVHIIQLRHLFCYNGINITFWSKWLVITLLFNFLVIPYFTSNLYNLCDIALMCLGCFIVPWVFHCTSEFSPIYVLIFLFISPV